jgi:hypothetical protein
LHIAGTNRAAATMGVSVSDFALIGEGHRLEAAVRMFANTTRARAGSKLSW